MAFQGFSSFQFLLVEVLLLVATASLTTQQAQNGCRNYCGDVEIPYPFGTSPDCYLNEDFLITCNDSYNPPRAFLRKSTTLSVTKINISGQLHALSLVSRDCYKDGQRLTQNRTIQFSLSEFTISDTQNKFIVVGCDSYAYIRGFIGNESYRSGCISLCDSMALVTNGSCAGTGCCQIDIPKRLKQITYTARSLANHTNVSDFNPCTYAFIVEQSKFNFSTSDLFNLTEDRFPTVLDWTITGNGTSCEGARSNPEYACKENAECYEPHNSSPSGYLCRCKEGYQGNPYLSNGCQDTDECKDPNLNDCAHECVNEEGSYTCRCRKGYHGDGKEGGEGCTPNQFQVVKVALGIGIGFVVLVLSISWLYLVFKKRKLIKLKQKFFQQNGGFLLQQQLNMRSGSSDTAKIFTAEELKKATNNFAEDRIIGQGGYGTVYKGFLTDDTPIAIKKSKIVDRSQIDQFVNEVVVLSQINHRNVVRLLGCCLETEVPLLVYEFVSNGNLHEHIHDNKKASIISWETRLRIAAETAGVLSYLHSSASTPIIHRDVKSSNILLDHNFTAKVSDFGASKLVPMDITQLSTMVQGTLGYLDPEYLHTSQLTEKSDVYSFGVVLVELMAGKKPILFDRPEEQRSLAICFLSSLKEDRLFEVLESDIVNDGNKQQLKEVAELARMCLRVKGEERPTMRELAMELDRLRVMDKHSWDQGDLDLEEKEYLIPKASDAYGRGDGSNTSTAVYDSMIRNVLVGFDGTGR